MGRKTGPSRILIQTRLAKLMILQIHTTMTCCNQSGMRWIGPRQRPRRIGWGGLLPIAGAAVAAAVATGRRPQCGQFHSPRRGHSKEEDVGPARRPQQAPRVQNKQPGAGCSPPPLAAVAEVSGRNLLAKAPAPNPPAQNSWITVQRKKPMMHKAAFDGPI